MFKLTTNLLTRFSSAQPRTKYLFLFGAPGVGKGTFAKKLYKDLDYAHISTGDEFRNIIKGKGETTFSPELVNKIKGIVQTGGLVSD
jgi:adenylate kinase